jgi:hypothetical protein
MESGEVEIVVPTGNIALSGELDITEVIARREKIVAIQRGVLQDGIHYGRIPGIEKPSLLKPGAEALGFTFRFVPAYEVKMADLGNDHREYTVVCRITHGPSGSPVGEGLGSCSTKESKYRWRKTFLATEVGPVPKKYWDTPQEKMADRMAALVEAFGPGRYKTKKTDSGWVVLRLEGDDGRQENPDIADQYNTVLKMAKKRAFIDATITACGVSDIFTQDIEDTIDPDDHQGDTQTESKKDKNATVGVPKEQPPTKKAEPISLKFVELRSQVLTMITDLIKPTGAPDAWTEEERSAIDFKTIFKTATDNRDYALMQNLGSRIELYASYRKTPKAKRCLELIVQAGSDPERFLFAVEELGKEEEKTELDLF